ncbi:MAG: DUF5606 domain-containing protein [Saprospiraceae bacterium]|nr:DUF5606 domain-containing protein [Saprospiraceae bacterium]
MDLKNLIAVSGMPGLYRMAGNRANGLIVEELETGKRKFAPSRKHQFTPLESISIFTMDDATELTKVFQNMLDQLADNPPPAENVKSEELRDYFMDILPDHDPDRVHPSDIRKVIRWFGYLNDKGYLTETAGDEEE